MHQTQSAAHAGAPQVPAASRADGAPARCDSGSPLQDRAREADAALVQRCRRGERAAWSELVDRYSAYVYAIATRYGLSADRTEDVYQDVFTRAYTHVATLQDDGSLRPWIAQMTRHAAIDRLRSDAHELPVGKAAEAAGATPDLDAIDEAMIVDQALRELPAPLRETLERFFIRDQSYRTIGDALSLAPGTVASRISRGLSLLRAALDADSSPPSAVGRSRHAARAAGQRNMSSASGRISA